MGWFTKRTRLNMIQQMLTKPSSKFLSVSKTAPDPPVSFGGLEKVPMFLQGLVVPFQQPAERRDFVCAFCDWKTNPTNKHQGALIKQKIMFIAVFHPSRLVVAIIIIIISIMVAIIITIIHVLYGNVIIHVKSPTVFARGFELKLPRLSEWFVGTCHPPP